MNEPFACFGDIVATGLRDVTTDLSALDGEGWWAAVMAYEGQPVVARFDQVRRARPPAGPWQGPARDAWTTSLDEPAYVAAVEAVREHIAAGDVYQANVCRVLQARLPDPSRSDIAGLAALLRARNPAPHGGVVRLPAQAHPVLRSVGGVHVATASPELFLARDDDVLTSSPIKGTGRTAGDLLAKDEAENVMIVDLVRNDLSMVCETGSVEVPSLLRVEPHPGLVHLVSTVTGRLRHRAGWADVMAATFPPGSVTGAPKSSATRLIASLEPVPRGPYCGAVGWVDADRRTAALAVGIRTFWLADDVLRFGAGAGITWGSDAAAEWRETELKAAHLLGVAAGTCEGGTASEPERWQG